MRALDPGRKALLRSIPSVGEVLSLPEVEALIESHPRQEVARAVRIALEEERRRILEGEGARGVSGSTVREAIRRDRARGLRPVVNATGVILHTNLGRAPLPQAAMEAVARIGGGYSNLELDLEAGKRGSRHEGIASLLREILGVEDALAVNNNAGAVLLALAALAGGGGCIVSRGELVEIGGGFRIPEVMAQAGSRLVEVGTTNRTRLEDYERAIDADTALLVKVLPSNFSMQGFVEEATIEELAALARSRGLPLYVDLGSGYLRRMEGAPAEPTIEEALRAGADVVSFSGDKMLGGPQAGFLVGKREWLGRMERHPLLRALRMDKLCLAAAEATLRLHRDGREGEIPAMAMIRADVEELMRRARELVRLLEERGIAAEIRETVAAVGGGAAPSAAPPSVAVAVQGEAGALQRELRSGEPPILARVEEERLLLDLRTIPRKDLEAVAGAVARARRNVEGVYA